MSSTSTNKRTTLTVGVSTSAIFDMREGSLAYNNGGLEAYRTWTSQQDILKPWHAFPVLKTLKNMGINMDIVLLSHNDPSTLQPALRTMKKMELIPTRTLLTGGEDFYDEVKHVDGFRPDWFISTNEADVVEMAKMGIASSTITGPDKIRFKQRSQLRCVWDVDRVLAGSDSDQRFSDEGPVSFIEHETDNIMTPLDPGPFLELSKIFAPIADNDILTARADEAGLRGTYSATFNGLPIKRYMGAGDDLRRDAPFDSEAIPRRKSQMLRVTRDKYPDSLTILFEDSPPILEAARQHVICLGVPRTESGHGLAEAPTTLDRI